MLRPFPQYTGIADPYGNVGQLNYHALQASLQQRLSHGLTFNVNYTFSKALGTINGIRSAYIGEKETISNTDMPHVLNAFFSYDLPFGKGASTTPDNKWCDRWSVAGRSPVSHGTPRAHRSDLSRHLHVPQAGTCWASYQSGLYRTGANQRRLG